MLKNLLFYKLFIFNVLGALFMGVLYSQGYLQIFYKGDESGILYAITALFLYAMFGVFQRAFKLSVEINLSKELSNPYVLNHNAQKMLLKTEYLGSIRDWLTAMGIMGTVVGLAIMTTGIDVTNIESSFPNIFKGLSTAFYATLGGIFYATWLDINLRAIVTANSLLIKDTENVS